MRLGQSFVLIVWFVSLLAPARAGDWPQWRGPARDGVWEQRGLPEQFPIEGLKATWRRPIGGGFAGIAVAGGRVYTLDRRTQPREVERVLCLDAATGAQLWAHAYPVTYGKMDYGNGPRSTPTVCDGRVYTFGAVGHLHCFDARTGQVLWSHDTVKAFRGRIPMWGHACSPLVDGERTIVQIGGEPDASLVALDSITGKEIWRSLSDRPGYSSPILIERSGGREPTVHVRQLVYWTPEHIAGLNPKTGKVLWQAPFVSTYDVAISDPVWHDGVLLVSGYWEGSKALRFEPNSDQPKVLWEGRQLYLLMSTPLCRAGHIYALDKRDGLKCIELRTGKVRWHGEHVTPRDQNPHASLVWTGRQALIFNAKGELILAQPSPEGYRQISKATVFKALVPAKPAWAAPAFAEGCLFARNDEEIVCVTLVEKNKKPRGASATSPGTAAAMLHEP
jgi:outer membrane protein assembly factor BamB